MDEGFSAPAPRLATLMACRPFAIRRFMQRVHQVGRARLKDGHVVRLDDGTRLDIAEIVAIHQGGVVTTRFRWPDAS